MHMQRKFMHEKYINVSTSSGRTRFVKVYLIEWHRLRVNGGREGEEEGEIEAAGKPKSRPTSASYRKVDFHVTKSGHV